MKKKLIDAWIELNCHRVPVGVPIQIDDPQAKAKIAGAFAFVDSLPGVRVLALREIRRSLKVMGTCFHTKHTYKNCRHFVVSDAVAGARKAEREVGPPRKPAAQGQVKP